MTDINELFTDIHSGETITIPYKRYMELLGKEAAFDPKTVFVRHVNDGRMISLGKDWRGETHIIFPENPSVKHIDWIRGAIELCAARQGYNIIEEWMEREKVPLQDRGHLSETIQKNRKSLVDRLLGILRKKEGNND